MKTNKELAREYGVAQTRHGHSRNLSSFDRRTQAPDQVRQLSSDRALASRMPQQVRRIPTSAKEVQLLESDEAMFVNFLEYQDFKAWP